jgi:predicted transcriptional regulator
MSIEEATEILNNAVITEPSIKSYTYISAEEINSAIEKLISELENKEQEIKKLREDKNKNQKRIYTGKQTYLCYRV